MNGSALSEEAEQEQRKPAGREERREDEHDGERAARMTGEVFDVRDGV